MPGRVSLSSNARSEFLRGERDEPRMGGRVDERRVPRGIGQGRASHKCGEFRRSVKPSESSARSVRHCEAKVRFHTGYGMKSGLGWHGDLKRYATSYLTREGAGIDGERPEHFTSENGQIVATDVDAFLKAAANDRAVIEIFIPPNDGDKIKDMPGFVTAVVARIESDWDTKLTWTAVVHEKHDVAHPVGGPKNKHAHVLARGVDDQNRELWISKEYLTSTLRDVMQKELSAYPTNELEKGWRLGPMTQEESDAFQKQMADNRPARIAKGWTQETEQDRLIAERNRGRSAAAENGPVEEGTTQRRRDRSRDAGMGDE